MNDRVKQNDLDRSKIRYALFRCSSNTAEKEHLDILDSYKDLMNEYNLSISQFSITWDIGQKDLRTIVEGFEVTSSRNDLFTQNEKNIGVSLK